MVPVLMCDARVECAMKVGLDVLEGSISKGWTMKGRRPFLQMDVDGKPLLDARRQTALVASPEALIASPWHHSHW